VLGGHLDDFNGETAQVALEPGKLISFPTSRELDFGLKRFLGKEATERVASCWLTALRFFLPIQLGGCGLSITFYGSLNARSGAG
jgi:hypothetical protein